MKLEELQEKARQKDLVILDMTIWDWIQYAATKEQSLDWRNNRELPDDLTVEEVIRVSESIFA